ncbi:zinc-binding alcohol dehydrogenase family protein [Weissella viridescens]|uniref:Zinc-binding alcohol dehydrogenase family protein n=1 Tax=Weissella viridescens TaxID=1629 RepID=A0A3P2RC31_WEIVI|nr:zinc-binding alcohol dehydrogenase family protein [Weissella viridescens]RRG18144.1 zinc-binding alcohol dehydrogenase family protein [Weissella viridescens]
MKAIQIKVAGGDPVVAEIPVPTEVAADQVRVHVQASALSNLAKRVATGAHYSADDVYPKTVGLDGVGTLDDGTYVYFDHPLDGALAEEVIVPIDHVMEIPTRLDPVTAAALPNPGMSSYAALIYRAQLRPGETVLINGATGVAGQLAVKMAYALGAKKVIATGRRAEALNATGADVTIASNQLDLTNPESRAAYGASLATVAGKVDVVLDYLYGPSAEVLLTTLAQTTAGSHPVRYVEVGAMAGATLTLPASLLRSSKLSLMGSGLQAVDAADLQDAVANTYQLAGQYGWQVPTRAFSFDEIATAWTAPNNPRAVITF